MGKYINTSLFIGLVLGYLLAHFLSKKSKAKTGS